MHSGDGMGTIFQDQAVQRAVAKSSKFMSMAELEHYLSP
jgi:hypothetical protein